jgi:hypothetical protein
MELIFGIIVGVVATLVIEHILVKNNSAKVFNVDGRQLVELMHKKEAR